MAKTCTFCTHKDRQVLERALLQREKTQQEVADILGVHKSSVSRHMRQHTQDTKRMDTLEKQLTELAERVSTLGRELKEHRMWGGHRRA
jgi:predicted transcriptional regulator